MIRTPKQPIEMNPLASQRSEQVERDLNAWAQKPIDFSFDPFDTHLFSMIELARSYAKRYADLAKAIRLLIANDQLVPATILARALVETIAVGCLYLHDMDRLIAAGDLEKLYERFKRYFAGAGKCEIRPIHVNDGLRYLEKVDAKYYNYLDEKYGTFSKLIESIAGPSEEDSQKRLSELISVMSAYDALCEVSHPNGTGTQLVYPADGEEDANVGPALQRLRTAALVTIWQGHHLLRALENNAELPERFRSKFLPERT